MEKEAGKALSITEKQKILLEILEEIDGFCRTNNIPYSLSWGTLLGAVRHGGFIPWDDDADIIMLREDFDRFLKSYKSEKYHLLFDTSNEDEYFYTGFAKVSDPSTFRVEKRFKSKYGVAVDIFPLEAVPEDPEERRKAMHRMMRVHNRMYHRQKKDLLSFFKAYYRSMKSWARKSYKLTHSGKYDGSPLVAQVIGTDNYRSVFEKTIFDDLAEIDFEGRKFLTVRDTHKYLTAHYGKNYMTPRKWAHNDLIIWK